MERAGVKLGDSVVVQGSGPVGLSAAAFASMSGAELVIVIGAPAARLELARRLGADLALPLAERSRRDRREEVLDLTRGGAEQTS